jgi:hypothetical protein
VDLADEAVDVDHEPLCTRSRARLPRPPQRLSQHPVELTHVAESKCRKNVPKVERAGSQPPNSRRVRPARSSSQSSMQSAPSAIA